MKKYNELQNKGNSIPSLREGQGGFLENKGNSIPSLGEGQGGFLEQHPLEPFLPENAWLLMLGSFPPSKKRWSMDFFYPNFINDMWRIFGLLFFNDKDHFVDIENKRFKKDMLVDFLSKEGVALYDTACTVRRTKNTASDKDLEVVKPTDLDALLSKLPHCTTVITTGEKAATVFASHFGCPVPKVGTSVDFSFKGKQMKLFRMPSSSRAYPMKLEKKAEMYKIGLERRD